MFLGLSVCLFVCLSFSVCLVAHADADDQSEDSIFERIFRQHTTPLEIFVLLGCTLSLTFTFNIDVAYDFVIYLIASFYYYYDCF